MSTDGNLPDGQPRSKKAQEELAAAIFAMLIVGLGTLFILNPAAITDRIHALTSRPATPTPEPADGQILYLRNADGTFYAHRLPSSIGGYTPGPYASPTPSRIDQQRGWQSTSTLQQKAHR